MAFHVTCSFRFIICNSLRQCSGGDVLCRLPFRGALRAQEVKDGALWAVSTAEVREESWVGMEIHGRKKRHLLHWISCDTLGLLVVCERHLAAEPDQTQEETQHDSD